MEQPKRSVAPCSPRPDQRPATPQRGVGLSSPTSRPLLRVDRLTGRATIEGESSDVKQLIRCFTPNTFSARVFARTWAELVGGLRRRARPARRARLQATL